MTTIEQFNRLDNAAATALMARCCGSRRWAARMAASRPYQSIERLIGVANACWRAMEQRDFLEAFDSHPKIGQLRGEPSASRRPAPANWAAGEQAGVAHASARLSEALARGNADYEKKFGFIFIVCASGKSAEQMLALMRARLGNDRAAEIANAAEEQRKITAIRIRKLFESPTIPATPGAAQ